MESYVVHRNGIATDPAFIPVPCDTLAKAETIAKERNAKAACDDKGRPLEYFYVSIAAKARIG